ncbi:methylated-DNA--[protein]-cysteine S-methyltransferase [Cupriavidus sp. UGS-1]|uniref:methylated-DNA--[protein]-cysteine S-methyltransferase n=1 Tax=Cupriavidus sp. UGS-1 TaxID=2899826 RepID=UPI001E488131|nr:methylated-DNA--[protein]-cysteine S-methyltransferase [Cupriavidus sp. UGS-1]MCD9121006.1 methylated-DNA--[protein]-cysteine S-methyltransferase [Cupriavidus sp. UGS-1]
MIHYRSMSGPLGDVLLRAEDGHLTGMFFSGQKYHPAGPFEGAPADARHARLLEQAAQELTEYFAGARQHFTVPLRLAGSAFQQRVWQALCEIPFGQTVSYGQLALGLGLPPSHARAVGSAVGRNPISVIVPCHRVLGANGALTGYAGGTGRKQALLRLEGTAAAPHLPLLRDTLAAAA